MNVQALVRDPERRTTTDEVFERLHADIVNLRLVPGSKLSEVEVAKQSNTSRQPVREAFIRLSNMNLLLVRPQKATLVRKISMQAILNARFIRTAVEIEVVRHACVKAERNDMALFEKNLKLQKRAATKNQVDVFHEQDYQFHKLVCAAAKCEFAFATISENKAHVDRLCMIELASKDGMLELHRDHSGIVEAISKSDEKTAIDITRLHLSRLDGSLESAREKHRDYFED